MTTVRALHFAKYDTPAYEPVGDGIYRRALDGQLVLALSLELEPKERAHLVLEDIMLEYRVSATSDTHVVPNGDLTILNCEFEGALPNAEANLVNLRRMSLTVGLRAYEVIVSPHEIKLVFERAGADGKPEVVYERWVDSGLHKRILE
jgi:hypothetical protein